MDNIGKWCMENDMALNHVNCKELMISFVKDTPNFRALFDGKHCISQVSSAKVPGLFFWPYFSFSVWPPLELAYWKDRSKGIKEITLSPRTQTIKWSYMYSSYSWICMPGLQLRCPRLLFTRGSWKNPKTCVTDNLYTPIYRIGKRPWNVIEFNHSVKEEIVHVCMI